MSFLSVRVTSTNTYKSGYLTSQLEFRGRTFASDMITLAKVLPLNSSGDLVIWLVPLVILRIYNSAVFKKSCDIHYTGGLNRDPHNSLLQSPYRTIKQGFDDG